MVAWLLWAQGPGWLRAALARPRAAWMLALSGLLIGFNWSLYIWAVNAGHVVESSLGYFINPLLNVVLGVAFLHERLSRAQWLSVALAAIGVAWLTIQFGQPPWIAICLALSLPSTDCCASCCRSKPYAGLGVESVYLFAPALLMLLWVESHGQGGFFSAWGTGVDALLIFGGALTALPLIGFSFAVRRVKLFDRRADPVHRPDPAIPDRRVRFPRGFRPGPPGRFRLHLGGAGDLCRGWTGTREATVCAGRSFGSFRRCAAPWSPACAPR